MKTNIKNSFSVELETKLTSEELFVISVALQKLKQMNIEEINKELEYYSKYIEEDKIKDIARKLHDETYCTLRGLEIM
jgi:glucose-6-phosphate-specific signal transduction histidine kinase